MWYNSISLQLSSFTFYSGLVLKGENEYSSKGFSEMPKLMKQSFPEKSNC